MRKVRLGRRVHDVAHTSGMTLMNTLVYLNGQFLSKKEAKVSIFDHGYLFGDGIFETLRSYNGTIFKLGDHMDRLFDSAKYVRMSIPVSKTDLQNLCRETLKRSSLKDAYLRITVSRGIGDRGIDPDSCKSPTLSIIVKDLPLYPEEYYISGIPTRIVSVRKTSDESVSYRVKSCNYQNNILARIELNQYGLIEGFILNSQGLITEGTVSNVFIIKRGNILTPSPACGCLEGITRNTVIEIAETELKVRVQSTQITRFEVYTADECFITNTLMEMIPVVSVDGRPIGDGSPGRMTQKLHRLFRQVANQEKQAG